MADVMVTAPVLGLLGAAGTVTGTRAHVGHRGHLPALARDGFRGPVLCTAPTAELGAIVSEAAAHLQEAKAAYASRKGYSKHHPACRCTPRPTLPVLHETTGTEVPERDYPQLGRIDGFIDHIARNG